MTLYKGPIVDILGGHGTNVPHQEDNVVGRHWVKGTIILITCTFGWSGFFIVQYMTLKEYPVELSLTAWICFAGIVEAGVAALIMERDMSVWMIGFDSRFLASAYSGVVCSGIAYYVQGVLNKARGPIFVTSFSPLCMIITAVLGAIVLSEQVHLRSMIGAIIIVIGLYTVVWEKTKDHKLASENGKAPKFPMVIDNTKASIVEDGITGLEKISKCTLKKPVVLEP